jgi:hypothetical protein
MKYEAENRTKAGMMSPVGNMLKRGPDVRMAAKTGDPAMTAIRPTIPVNIPVPVAAGTGTTDVTVSTVPDGSTLDSNPDARLNKPADPAAATPPAAAAAAVDQNAPIVSKGTIEPVKKQKKVKEPKKKKN